MLLIPTQYLSALRTFDILRNYAAMPVESIEDIARIIDDPSNGMMLQIDARDGFDEFLWSLKATDVRET